MTKERSETYQVHLWETKAVRTWLLIACRILDGLIKVYSTTARPDKWLLVSRVSAAEIHRTAHWSWDDPLNKWYVFSWSSMMLWDLEDGRPDSWALLHCWLPLMSVHSMCACRKTFQEGWRESFKCTLKVIYRFLSHFLLSSPVFQKEMGTFWLKGIEGRVAYSTPFIAYKWYT